MKQISLLLLVVALILTACSSGPISDAYTAAGDDNHPDKTQKTRSFKGDDDLNVVVVLNTHTRTLPIYAVFTGPTGNTYSTDPVEADKTTGKVLLGLDWETQGGGGSWPAGEWTAEVYVEQTKEATLEFEVAAAPAQ